MNSTMFFDKIGTHDQNVFALSKRENGDIQVVNNNIANLEINKEIIALPLNLISAAYSELSPSNEQIENKEGKVGLYRPISPNNDEQYSVFGYRNSPSPGQEGNRVKYVQRNNFVPLNGQTLVFEKFSHISQEIIDKSNNFHHHSSNNLQNNNNYNSQNNNVHNSYGHLGKSRISSVVTSVNSCLYKVISKLLKSSLYDIFTSGHKKSISDDPESIRSSKNIVKRLRKPNTFKKYQEHDDTQEGSKSSHQNNQPTSNNNNINREHRRRPVNSYYRYTPDVMVRRAHGLTHRFKSRSEIMKVDPNPSQLLNGGLYDQLSRAIYDVFTSKAQKAETYEKKIQLWKDLFLYIRRCVSHYALYIVGSTMTGFGLNTSDIDMCLLIRPCTEDPRLDSLHQLHHIKNHLLKYGLIIDSELILAKVPILKFREYSTGFEIDLNCNNSVGIYNTHLLYCYARCDWRVRPLVVMVKLWAQANRINDAKNMTVSSYSWTLMVIHYLQCGVSPQVLPCLHTLYPEHFNADKSKITDVHEDLQSLEEFRSFNAQSLAELFIGFFGYYANFDFNQYAISVRAGGCLLIEDCKQVKAPKNDHNQWKYLCIEEPFDFTNTARSVYDIAAFRLIKNILTKSYDELVRTKVLNSVLPVVFDTETPVIGY